MPVIDHPVHPSTIQGQDARYGCHNQPRREEGAGYWAPDREYLADGRWIGTKRFIKDRASIDCKYDMSATDTKCAGCCWIRSGEPCAAANGHN